MSTQLPKQTILHLSTTSGPGGAERVISSLSASLNTEGRRVMVGLFRPGWLQTECERLGVETIIMPLSGPLHLGWFLNCLRLIRRERVALIHAHEFSAIVYGWIVSRLARIPFIGTIHGKNYFWEKARRRAAYRIIARTATLVAVSEDLKRFVVERIGIPADRIKVIYNGVTPSPPVNDAEVERCRVELGIQAGDIVLGSVGSLYPVKGHTFLLDAMQAVLERFPNTVLIIAGRGELEVPLKDQAKSLGIEQNIRLLGMRQDIPRLLALMDVFVLPSLSEGLSMALLEAMAAGKPVVATRVGGNPELVQQGHAGLLVPSQDAGGLADALIVLLGDPITLRRFGEAGAERVRKDFSTDHMAEQYRRLY
ncbi:MAG: glycosyltransferase family 4 protein [Nitrospira sp.]|nr:glycosyltransferase family 4 protein [Nitrospira sp.]